MPLRLEIKRRLTARSDRVKCVDLHPTEPWMLASLYNGNVHVWNHESQQLVKSFEVCELPVRAGRFVPRKNWIVTGSDDMQLRIYNYNTLERVHAFEAHSDYVRCIVVHPTQPYLLTSSDDMLIKLWNWDRQWACQQVFEGHTHYVMQIVVNPKDNNTLASASLDRTLKVWQLGSANANFTLEGHEKGVNCVDYYHGGDKPYLISGADDRLVKIWDYQNKTCVQTLEGHAQNISAVCFHPELPIVLTGSEDGSVRLWHAGTYRLESSLNYGLERVWTIAALKGSNNVALGYDEGSVMIKLGREEPAISMDAVGGKIIWAKHADLHQANLKALGEQAEADAKDGERLALAVKDMGSCDIYPQTIAHNPNGRFVVVCGDGEYIIYTAMALRNKAYGSAHEFVWAADSSEYATREGTTVRLFRNFKERRTFRPEPGAEAIFGGQLLGVRSAAGFALHDWDTLDLVRRIEAQPRHVFWNESGELLCLASDDAFYILRYDSSQVTKAREANEVAEDGVEAAFQLISEVNEVVRTGLWVGDCFIYTNAVNRINYFVGGEIVTVAHLDRSMYLLGYVPRHNRLYLGDKELAIVSFGLELSVLEYQTAIMRGDFNTADTLLGAIPKSQRTRVAHFLEKQGYKQQALAVSTDSEHRFELALQLGELKIAESLALEAHSQHKWRQLAELATQQGELKQAQEALHHANDLGGLLLLATSSGDAEMVSRLADTASATGKSNIAFLALFLLGRLEDCLELLITADRIPEAAFLAQTHLPSQMSRVVTLWREQLSKVSEKAGQSLADPAEYENLFPGYAEACRAEERLRVERQNLPFARDYPNIKQIHERNPIAELREAEESGVATADLLGSFSQMTVTTRPLQQPSQSTPVAVSSEPSTKPAVVAAVEKQTPIGGSQSVLSDDSDELELELELDGIPLDSEPLDEDLLSDD